MTVKSIRMATLATVLALGCSAGSEPEAPGSVDVYLAVTGIPTDTTPHAVVVTAGFSELSSRRVPYQGGNTRVTGIPAGSHSIRVETAEATCWVTSPNPQELTIVARETVQASFALSCFGPPARVYNRVEQGARAFSDRFIVEPDGTVRLQFLAPGHPIGEIRGFWSRSGFEYRLSFALDEWATGAVHGDCLSIRFSPRLSLSDYEDGEFCAAPGPAYSYGKWTTRAPLPEARVQAGVTSLDGIVYVAGGTSGGRWNADILAYDPAVDRWRRVGVLPKPVLNPAMAAVGDRIYIVGGFGNHQFWNPSAYLQVFDPATGNVVAGPPSPTARSGASAVALDGKLHVLGGDLGLDPIGGSPSDAHEVFDPSTGAWTSRAPLPIWFWRHDAVALDRKIHIVDGATHLTYDTDLDSWTSRTPGGSARYGAAAALLGRDLYLIGGSDPRGWADPSGEPALTREVSRLDLVTYRWTRLTDMPTSRSGFGVAVAGGSIYLVGGHGHSFGPPYDLGSVLERFTPVPR